MSAYFGNGYLLNILQRGASPVVKARPGVRQPPLRVEETFTTTENQSLEAHSESIDRPVTTSAVTKMAIDGPLTRPSDNQVPNAPAITAGFHAREVPASTPETKAIQEFERPSSPDARGDRLEPQVSHPASPASLDVIPSSSGESPEHDSPHENRSVGDAQPEAKPGNRIFELRMPEDFFRDAKVQSTPIQSQTQPEKPGVSAEVARPADSEVALSLVSDLPASVRRTRVEGAAQNEIVPPPAMLSSRNESQNIQSTPQSLSPVQLSPTNSNAPQVLTPQVTAVASKAAIHEPQPIERPIAPAPVLVPDALVPTSKLEQPSGFFKLRQPPTAPAAAAPQARLRINRIDIQVVNNVRPPVPAETRTSDVGQTLEKRHLGRVELLL